MNTNTRVELILWAIVLIWLTVEAQRRLTGNTTASSFLAGMKDHEIHTLCGLVWGGFMARGEKLIQA
jgi:hypothetical protein